MLRRGRLLDRRTFVAGAAGLGMAALLGGCAGAGDAATENASRVDGDGASAPSADALEPVVPTADERQLDDGLSCVLFEGDDRLEAFLEQGGATSDAEVVSFLAGEIAGPLGDAFSFLGGAFGCSTVEARTPEGDAVFGRNFDWQRCEACIVAARPEGSYASVSTVNRDFLNQYGDLLDRLPAEARTLALMYAPLDGMNERGLAVAVLMIQDGATIAQSTGKPGLTTTTAVRALLDRAATVDEALELLRGCDLHASMGLMVHFALADAGGRAVAVEYVDDGMVVTETPVLTNFYVAEGDKQGVGTAQSHERFQVLSERLEASPELSEDGVRDALESVCKRHYADGETTEWSMVCNQAACKVSYYHREDYSCGWTIEVPR